MARGGIGRSRRRHQGKDQHEGVFVGVGIVAWPAGDLEEAVTAIEGLRRAVVLAHLQGDQRSFAGLPALSDLLQEQALAQGSEKTIPWPRPGAELRGAPPD